MHHRLQFHDTIVVVEAGLVVDHAVRVAVEPDGLGVARHDADLATVHRSVGVAQDLEDQHAVLGPGHAGDRAVRDRGDLGLALVVRDREARVRLHAREALL